MNSFVRTCLFHLTNSCPKSIRHVSPVAYPQKLKHRVANKSVTIWQKVVVVERRQLWAPHAYMGPPPLYVTVCHYKILQ